MALYTFLLIKHHYACWQVRYGVIWYGLGSWGLLVVQTSNRLLCLLTARIRARREEGLTVWCDMIALDHFSVKTIFPGIGIWIVNVKWSWDHQAVESRPRMRCVTVIWYHWGIKYKDCLSRHWDLNYNVFANLCPDMGWSLWVTET